MFGLSLPCQLIQGPAVRTWNCVAHFANLLWCKFNHVGDPTMPRSRRRHHSRSRTRSRSRSHSCDRDRDTKRRKIDNYESPHKRSDSPEDEEMDVVEVPNKAEEETSLTENQVQAEENDELTENCNESEQVVDLTDQAEQKIDSVTNENDDNEKEKEETTINEASKDILVNTKQTSAIITPKKPLTPKQMQKKLLSEEKRKERDKIKEEKLKILEEKKKIKQEELEKKTIEKQKKLEQKQKELEEKQKVKEEKKKKEREEKEIKRKEKEEKEEQKRKELMEKSIEKQKLAEKKEKTVAAFVNFFTKKTEAQPEEKAKETINTSTFMPFEVKSDMRLAPSVRVVLDDFRKFTISEALKKQDSGCTYLDELKSGKKVGKSDKTWLVEEANQDVVIVEDVNPGQTIEEQAKTTNKMRAKFFKFDGNRRPPYYGTWGKKSALIKPRKPFAVDNAHFDYDVDSDEDWEEDDSGESLRGSDDDKENDSENEYEEDNEFFVPHGHLSDDEVNDEEDVSPEAHKAKLKLLKKAFEEEMQSKTEKIKPRVIGCIWYNKDGTNVDSAIDSFLKPLSIISNGPVIIKKRSKFSTPFLIRRSFNRGKELSTEIIPAFLKFVHGSTKNKKILVDQFLKFSETQNLNVEVSKTSLIKKLKEFATWTRCPDGEPALKKHCWFVHKNFRDEYNVDLPSVS